MQRKMTLKVAQFFIYIAQSSKTFLQVFLMLPIMMGTFPTTLKGTIDNISRINKMSSNLVQLWERFAVQHSGNSMSLKRV